MITFYFLRHGQTTWNLSGKYQGSTDVPLSELGIRQAALAARWFDGMKIDAIYSSPQIRAQNLYRNSENSVLATGKALLMMR